LIETLKENQNCLAEKNEIMERKCSEMVERRCNEMMVIFQASLKQSSTQQEDAVAQPDLKAKV
jgi:hypothetical protein